MKNEIKGLSTNPAYEDFDFILNRLNGLLENLNQEINSQLSIINGPDGSLNIKEIENILERIDNEIMNNPIVKKAMISGSSEIKIIIDSINTDVKARMEKFKANTGKENYKKVIDQLYETYENNEFNSTSKKLKEYDKAFEGITQRTMKEREDAARSDEENLNERIARATITKEKNITSDELIDNKDRARRALLKIYKYKNENIDQLKTAKDYEEIVEQIYEKALTCIDDPTKTWSQEEIKDLEKKLDDLKAIESGNSKISELVNNIRKKITEEAKKDDPDKTEKIVDSQELKKLLEDDSIDWKTSVNKAKEIANEKVKKDLKKLFKDYNVLFEIFPQEAKKLLESENPNIEEVMNKLRVFLEDRGLYAKIKHLYSDLENLSDLKYEALSARIRANNLKKAQEKETEMNERIRHKSIISISSLGREFEVKDDKGDPVDITALKESNMQDEARDGYIEALCDQMMEKIKSNKEEDKEERELILSKYPKKQPGILRSFFYKINPMNWNNADKSLAHKEMRDWIRGEIKKGFDYVIQDAKAPKPVWSLSSEQQKEFEEGQEQLLTQVANDREKGKTKRKRIDCKRRKKCRRSYS